jgi:hypothetical protein
MLPGPALWEASPHPTAPTSNPRKIHKEALLIPPDLHAAAGTITTPAAGSTSIAVAAHI